jgi:superfamily I DNA and/or RNA helicase
VQVSNLSERLGRDARVGTVDKFLGQEAAVVIYSLTTSSQEDAPRGMEFLYSLNRLNVATSRGRATCIVVGSPTLLEPIAAHLARCNWQMRYASTSNLPDV